jgi:tetratricopeptide (TPR) repeat protein
MGFAEQLRVLQAAQGDPAKLVLVTVDLAFPELPSAERFALMETLEAAAIPHWCDPGILGTLLEIRPEESDIRFARLRKLTVVEPFPARGESVVNIHEAARHALRRRLDRENPKRFRALSRRVQAALPAISDETAAPYLRIEALYHRFISDPKRVAEKCGAVFHEWKAAGQLEPLLALRTMLEELINREEWTLPSGLARGAALYYLARIRLGYRRVSDEGKMTEDLARKAVAEFKAAKEGRRTLRARAVLGNVLEREATSDKELEDALTEYDAVISLVEKGGFGPSDDDRQRFVSNLHQDIERVQKRLRKVVKPTVVVPTSTSLASAFQLAARLEVEKNNFMFALSHFKRAAEDALRRNNFKVALESFREIVTIHKRMAAEEPGNANHLAHLAFAHNCVGDVHRRQGDARAASGAFETAMKFVESLVKRDPFNAEWQKDLAAACARTGRELLQLLERDQAEARRLIQRGTSIMQTLSHHHPLTLLEQEVFEDLQQLAAQADPAPPARGER